MGLISRKELIKVVKTLRSSGKKIVTTNGAFDLFHAGHLKTLKFAKEQGDILIVCLNSDSSIKKYKSEKRPIIPEAQRAEIVASIRYVDYVVLFEEKTPVKVLCLISPDVHVKGAEYRENMPEKKVVEDNGGKIIFINRMDSLSTSMIIEKIIKMNR